MRRWPFLATPPACRAWTCALVLAAGWSSLREGVPDLEVLWRVVLPLLALVVFDAEAGRRAEGGRLVGQRPHKGLSAWPFAAVLLTGEPATALVVVPVYAYAWWRGLRVPVWKWVGSASIVALAAQTALIVVRLDGGPATGVVVDLRTAVVVVVAALAFLAAEAAGLWGAALSNDPVDEQWLKAQLSSRGFYTAELAVLAQAVVVAALLAVAPVLLLFAAPSYAVLQRALLHAPLREAADRDGKTGLLTHAAWHRRAQQELATGRPCAVLLVDLDHFKAVNDRYGHLVGDQLLVQVAAALGAVLRPQDLLGRFGGEEFCVLTPDLDDAGAAAVAERLRAAVAGVELALPRVTVTCSIGTCATGPVAPDELDMLLSRADAALYAAKAAGRDAVRSEQGRVPSPRRGERPTHAS